MTRLAMGGKFGNPGKPPTGFGSEAAKRFFGKRPASAMIPRPRAAREKNCRRVTNNGSVRLRGIEFIDSNHQHPTCNPDKRHRDLGGIQVSTKTQAPKVPLSTVKHE